MKSLVSVCSGIEFQERKSGGQQPDGTSEQSRAQISHGKTWMKREGEGLSVKEVQGSPSFKQKSRNS